MNVTWILLATGIALGFVLLARTPEPEGTAETASMSVIVPARDEATVLPALLTSLGLQAIPIGELIVVDDGSGDGTAEVARAAGTTVIVAPPLPDGWVGKPWACHIGANRATGDVLVFLDADVSLAPDGLERVVATWQREAPDGLLSVQPHHRTSRAYEQLSAYPNLVSMMATGAFSPFRRRPGTGAFGPCLVTSAAAYRAVGGHESVAGEIIEDMHLAHRYRSAGRPVQIAAGGTAVAFRMYPKGLRQLIDGWTKNLAGGPRLVGAVPLLGAVAWVLASVAIATDAAQVAIDVARGGSVDGMVLVAYLVVAGQLALLLRRIGRFAWWAPLAFPLLLAGFVGLFTWSALRRAIRGSVRWHDRTVAVSSR